MFGLAFLLSNWKLILGGLLVLSLVGYIGYKEIQTSNLRADVTRLEHNVEVYKKAAEENAKAVEQLEQIQKKMQEATRASEEYQKKLELLEQKIRQERSNVQGPNLPAGPRTQHTIDRLREWQRSNTVSNSDSGAASQLVRVQGIPHDTGGDTNRRAGCRANPQPVCFWGGLPTQAGYG